MLFGHSHGTIPGGRQTIDVGVDSIGYTPETLPQLQARIALLPRAAYDVGRLIEDNDETNEPEGFTP